MTVNQQLFGEANSFLQATLSNTGSVINRSSVVLNEGLKVEVRDNGVLYFEPAKSEQVESIVLSAGIHGNETAPIEIVDRLVDDILNGRFALKQRLLIILGNPPAIREQQRFQKENMNRLFSHSKTTSDQLGYERLRASKLMAHCTWFFNGASNEKLHLDLHAAIRASEFEKFAISPNRRRDLALNESIDFLSACGIEAMLQTDKSSATFSAFTSHHCGAISYTLELGKVRPFGENKLNDFAHFTKAIESLLSASDVAQNQEHNELKHFYVAHEIIKRTERFRLCFAQNIANFTEFKVGEILANDQNFQYKVTEPGERILFPNQHVAVGHRALVIIKTSLNYLCEN